MIRYSCHSENFGLRSAEETFSFIHALGFDCIDVASRSLVPQAEILANPSGCAARFRTLSQQYELPLSELFLAEVCVGEQAVSPVWAAPCMAEYEQNFHTICEFAHLAGFCSIMGSAGAADPELGAARSFAQAADTLRRQVKIAAQYGLHFHVEPSRTSLLNTVEAAVKMVEQAEGLRYTLDFLHYQINGIPLEKSLSLIPYAGHIHARQARLHAGKCDFARGEIDYQKIVCELLRLNWEGDIAMEFWTDPQLEAEGIQAVEQNLVMRYALKTLFRLRRFPCET